MVLLPGRTRVAVYPVSSSFFTVTVKLYVFAMKLFKADNVSLKQQTMIYVIQVCLCCFSSSEEPQMCQQEAILNFTQLLEEEEEEEERFVFTFKKYFLHFFF